MSFIINTINSPGKGIFLSGNYSSGFHSLFPAYINKLSKVYIIKGGPGTGKSGFLKQTADRAEGYGFGVTRVHCSSDPDSLDGVIIKELNIGFFDGTAPHTLDTVYPGIRDELIDLGVFWDSSLLTKQKKQLLSLFDKKTLCYKRAMTSLRLCESYLSEINTLLPDKFDSQSVEIRIFRMISAIYESEKPVKEYISLSPGMKGLYRTSAEGYTVFLVKGYSKYLFISLVEKMLKDFGISYCYSLSPFVGGTVCELKLPDNKIIYTLNDCRECAGKHIIISDDYLHGITEKESENLRNTKRKADRYLKEALSAFERMGTYHFELEQYYGKAMDFQAKDRFQKEYTDELFSLWKLM